MGGVHYFNKRKEHMVTPRPFCNEFNKDQGVPPNGWTTQGEELHISRIKATQGRSSQSGHGLTLFLKSRSALFGQKVDLAACKKLIPKQAQCIVGFVDQLQ